MSCEVALTVYIKVLIPCLLTCEVYLVMFNIDTMCTRVLHCDACGAMSWFILILILWMSFLVAVPVSQLRASPRKGSKLLLWWMCVCGWLDCSSFIADVIVGLPELYMSLMLDNSSWSIDSSWVRADGCRSRDWSSCCVLSKCLLKVFQWHSKFPSETYAVIIQDCWVGYACRTGWKITDSPSSILDGFVVGVNIRIVL